MSGNGSQDQAGQVFNQVRDGRTDSAAIALSTWSTVDLYELRRDCVRMAVLCKDEQERRADALASADEEGEAGAQQ